MKTNYPYLLVAIVIILVIAFSLATTVRVAPYSKNTFFSHEFPYEGFQGLEYGNTTGNVLDSNSSLLVNGPPAAECNKVYGFDGLFCKPYAADKNLDVFSSATSNPSCVGASSGLTNSKGGLCLDETQKRLLTTRGGNASGKEAQIGK